MATTTLERLKGFRNFGYFRTVTDTEEAYTASDRKQLDGAFSCSKTDDKTTTPIPADDNAMWDVENDWESTTLTVVVRQMLLADLAKLSGGKMETGAGDDLGMIEGIYDEAPTVALNFAALQKGEKYRCFTYFCAQLTKAEVNHQTTGGDTKTQDYTLEFKCKGRKIDGAMRLVKVLPDYDAAKLHLETIAAAP